jgi:hypothetical protein
VRDYLFISTTFFVITRFMYVVGLLYTLSLSSSFSLSLTHTHTHTLLEGSFTSLTASIGHSCLCPYIYFEAVNARLFSCTPTQFHGDVLLLSTRVVHLSQTLVWFAMIDNFLEYALDFFAVIFYVDLLQLLSLFV